MYKKKIKMLFILFLTLYRCKWQGYLCYSNKSRAKHSKMLILRKKYREAQNSHFFTFECVCVCVFTCHSTHLEVRKQLARVGFLLPPWGPRDQIHVSTLAAVPSCQPELRLLNSLLLSFHLMKFNNEVLTLGDYAASPLAY